MKNLSFRGIITSIILLCSLTVMPMHIYAQAPTTPASDLSLSSIDGDRFRVNFTRGDGAKRIIIAKADSPVTAVPVDGTDYLAGDFGVGNEIAPGEFVVYNGTSSSRTVARLTHSTIYHFKIYEYNGNDYSTQYLTSSYLEGSQSTLTNPTTQTSDITFSDVLGSNMKVNWTNGDGSGRILIARADSPVNVEPEDLESYSANYNAFGNQYYEIGTGNYALYAGAGNSVNITNLNPNVTYHFALFEYNGSSGKVYLTATSATNPAAGATANQTTTAYPTVNANNLTFSSIDGNRLRFRIENSQLGNGEKRVIVAKQGSPVTAVPVDGNEYTANTTFGDGDEIAPGEFVISNESGWINNRALSGLEPHTTYHFKIFEYNGSGTDTYYLKANDSNNAPVLAASQATVTYPTAQASGITFSDILVTEMKVNWTNGDGSGRILIARADSPVNVEPEDLESYSANYSAFGNGSYEIGTGNYALYQGTGNSVNITSLDPNTTYHFALYEYNGSSGKIYLTSTSSINPAPGATANQSTSGYSAPTINTNNIAFSAIDGNRFRFRLENSQLGDGEKRVIIAKQGSAVTAVPVNGNEYIANTTFGDGDEIAPGEFVISNESGWINNRLLSGLEPHTAYHLKIYEYNGEGAETIYLTTNDSNSDPVLEASQSTITYPTTQASDIEFEEVLGSKMKVTWTNGDGSGRILIARADSPVNVEPENLESYSANYSAFGNGSYEIGAGNYVLYGGTGTSANITNLDPNVNYHFALFEYNGSSGKLYLTSTSTTNPAPGAIASQSTNTYPTVNANNLTFTSLDGDRFRFRIENNQLGNGEKRVIVAKQGSAVTGVPVDGNEYTANTTFGDGDEIAPGEFVISNESGWINNRTLSGLEPHTTYHFKIYDYNGSGIDTYYLVTDDADDVPVYETSQATISYPTVQTNNIFVNSKTTTSFNVNWTKGDGSNRILIARANEPVDIEPQDLVNYNSLSAGFGNTNYEIDSGNYVLYVGTGTSVNVTNLDPGTNYHFALFEYNGNYGKAYLRPGYTFEAETFGATPTTQVSNISFADIGATSMHVNFTRGNGSSRLVIAKKGAPVDVEPSDEITYSADTDFGDGQELGLNNFVVYNGTDEHFQLTNLEESSEYHFAFFEYAINQNNESYMTPGAIASQATPTPPTVISSDFSYSRPCDSDLILNWTSGNGQGRLVVLSESPLNTEPTNATDYNASFSYGLGDAIGNGYVIYNAGGNMVPPNLLQASTDYYVTIYEYNGTKIDPIFNMTPLEGFIGDITAPNIVCNDIQVVLDADGNATITVEDIATIPTGDCGTLTSTIDISTFDCSNLGENTVTLTVTDSDNNSSSCVSIVTVVDETPPNVITKDISIQLDTNGTASIAEDAVDNGSTDACGPLTFATDITTFNNSNLGENTVTLTVTDGSNNASSATAIVTVIDIAAPINDDLCDAIALSIDATSAGDAYTNVGATAQTEEPNGSCWSGTNNPQTVWFSFEAPNTGNVTVTTDISGGTLTNTHLAIYEAPTDCNVLSTLGTEVGCDENGGVGNNNSRSIASLTGLISGNTYYVQVDGRNTNTGTFGIEVNNDGCLAPTDLSVDATTDTSADISWTKVGNETDWIVQYSDLPNFDPEAEGLSKTVNGLPSTELTGLSPNTTYQLYIKADCGSDDESYFAGPVTFTTSCFGNPSLSFEGVGEFQNSIISPTQGTPETAYEFRVVYTNEEGELPPYGFPRVVLDYEGNGVFTNPNDRMVILSPADPNDLDTTDGKLYVGSISQLPSGTNWEAWVQVQTDGCATEIGPFNVPEVLIASDLEIFANDIVFDNPNPDVSSPLQITATIHNRSDIPAENFVVHLENQFDITAVYDDIIVDHLGPHESTSLVWNIITPSIESWNPMEVFVDYTDVIVETNELNNRAIRPFTNGDFNIPGAINIQASASPSVFQLPSGNTRVTVSGYAYYTDTAVVLQDSTVAGATVSFLNPVTGSQVQTHTNARGYFSFATTRGAQVGIYTAPVEVTDFTITGETPVTWELIQGPCLPDLTARISPLSKSILEGESVSGTITVKNQGCAPVEVETLLEMNQTGGLPIIGNMTVPPLEPGESFSHDFTVAFNTVGTYYITGLADADDIVVESSENNNLGSMTIRVNPPLPDIKPYGSGSKGSRYLCSDNSPTSFSIENIGYVSTDYAQDEGEEGFDNTIDVYFNGVLDTTYIRRIQNINPGQRISVSIPYEYEEMGRYDFVVKTDVPLATNGVVDEISETNNSSSYYIDILGCRPDLYVSTSCDTFVVDPIDPEFPGTVTYSAQVGNRGNEIAPGPIDFEFTLSNGQVYQLQHLDSIYPGEMVTFTTSAVPTVASGDAVILTATVDPNGHITDRNPNNNSISETLCWEFEPVSLCGYNFWNTIYHEHESAQITVGLKVKHLYQASEVTVRFEVKEPGSQTWISLGDATAQNVNRCSGCPYRVALPTRFVFNESGVYTFRMTADPDNEYEECNEDNNVLIKEVTVANQPDMRILSQHINPTLLNPEPGETVFFDISYENIGYSNIDDRMDLTVLINDQSHAVVQNVPGLMKNRTTTIAVPVPYSSEIEGLHVVRAIIDSNQDTNDGNRNNNEATRSFVVGAAANLHFNEFTVSNETPEIGDTIDIDAFIANNGELDVDAEILFSYVSVTGDTIAIGTRPVNVPIGSNPPPVARSAEPGSRVTYGLNGGGETVSMPWTVVESSVKILGEIINTSELEFDYTDNFASAQLNSFNVSLVATLACEGLNMGTLTAEVDSGTAPYSYNWSNGYFGDVLEAESGTYSVTVIDATGKRAVATGTIEEDPDCVIPPCSLSAVSFDVPSSCNTDTGIYTTTVVVAYENEPTQGFITVNGTDYPITGSPQSFEVEFYSGPVVFNISFTEDNNCNLIIPTGITLEEYEQDCEGIYGGSVLPGTACLDTDGNPGVLDEDCFCEPDPEPEVCIAVTDVEVSTVAETTATVSWTASATATEGYVIEVYETGESTVIFTDSVDASVTSIDVTGLSPDTTYEVYVTSDCGNGETATSGVINFTTDAPMSCDTVTDIVVNDLTETTATVSWTISATATEGYVIEVYEVGASTVIFTDSVDAAITSVDVTGLSPNTTYEVYVTSDCGNGETATSGVVNFTTDAPMSCDAVTDVVINTIAETTATVSWTISATATEGYVIEVYEAGASTIIFTDSVASSVTSVEVTGLSPDTTYEVYVTSDCGNGETAASGVVNFTTDAPMSCDAVTDVVINTIAETTATVSWTISATATEGYVIEVYEAGASTIIFTDSVASSVTSVDVTGLSPDTAYDVFVTSDCDNSETATSAVVSFTTDAFICDALTAIVVDGITETTATISWIASATATDGYVVEVYKSGVSTAVFTESVGPSVTSVAVTGLFSDTDYEVYITSDCGSGVTSTSAVVLFTTIEVPVLCEAVTDVVVSVITETSATVSWTASATAANGYVVEVYEEGESILIFTESVGSDMTSVDITDLTPDTTYKVYITSDCGDGNNTTSEGLAFTTEPLIGVDDFSLTELTIYPNPVTSDLHISASTPMERIQVYTVLEQLLMTVKTNSSEVILDVSSLATATYILKVTIDGSVSTVKFVKK